MKRIKSYSSFSINESRLIMSPELLQFLEEHNGLYVARKLLQLQFDEDATETFNFLQPQGTEHLLFSRDKDFLGQDEQNFDWKSQSTKNFAKVGRLVKKLLEDKGFKVSDSDIEHFFKYWKSHFTKPDDYNIRIVSGEDIRKWYDESNYHTLSQSSSLGRSCMAKSDCQPYFDIYVQNPEVCQMIILTDKEDKLLARALLWTDVKGNKIVDRIYYVNTYLQQVLTKWAHKNIPGVSVYLEDYNQGGDPTGKPIKLKKWKFDQYPYLDTFQHLNWSTGQLTPSYTNKWNYNDTPVLALTSTSGGYRLASNGFVWSEKLKDYLKKDLAYWDKDEGSYLPLKGLKKIGKIIKKYLDF